MNAGAVIILGLLLALPGYALSQLGPAFDIRIVIGVAVALSAVAFFTFRSDKRRAEAGASRVPEATLHVLALLGGWPGAFLAQQVFHHKTAKLSFQFIFWLIVLSHEFAALDSLLDWRLTREIVRVLKSQAA